MATKKERQQFASVSAMKKNTESILTALLVVVMFFSLDFYFPEITVMAKASILAISAFVAYLSFSKLIFAKR
ncbi:hypothetical protein [Arsukibacterium sp.]|uniref:hypothetical protein n=1 Tax=Arsukibacterium sp. TaxID=1977258 RepID=UPI001BD3E853|nr:hypothetical protein [Arsukibacterium sp.]